MYNILFLWAEKKENLVLKSLIFSYRMWKMTECFLFKALWGARCFFFLPAKHKKRQITKTDKYLSWMSFFFLSCQQHGSAQMQTDYSAAVLNAKTLHHCFKQRISELVSKSLKNNTLHKNRHFLLICIKLPNKSVLFKYSFFFANNTQWKL